MKPASIIAVGFFAAFTSVFTFADAKLVNSSSKAKSKAPSTDALATATGSLSTKTKIGFIAGFTGSDNNTARELYRGVDIFFTENPKAKEFFEIEKTDNESSISKTIEILERMYKEKTKIVIGVANSNEALAAAKYTNANNMLFVTPFATNTEVTNGKPLAFRMCFTDLQQGNFLAEYTVNKIKAKKVLILKNTDSKYSQGLSDYYKSALKDKTVLVEQTYANDLQESDYTRLTEAFAKEQPDLVFIPDHIMRASLLTKRLKPLLKDKVQVLGGDGFGGRKIFMAVMGEENNINLTYSTHWEEKLNNRVNKKFVTLYKSQFGDEPPTSGAAFTYDLMNMLYANQDAMKKPDFSVAELAKKIRSATYETTVGSMKFQDGDNSPTKPIIMMSFKNGKYQQAK